MFSKTTKLAAILQAQIVCISVNDSLATVSKVFQSHDFHHLPVVNEEGEIIGIVSHNDLKYAEQEIAKNSSGQLQAQQLKDHWRAERFMTRNPTFLRPEDTVGKAASYFLNNKFHALLILDNTNDLVGIVTNHDLLQYAYGI